MSEPMTVEYTERGWYAGQGGLGARGRTREEAVAKLRRVQEIVQRGAAKWQAKRDAKAGRTDPQGLLDAGRTEQRGDSSVSKREAMEAMQRALGS